MSLGIGLVSYNHNLAEGNYSAATLDSIGIVVDVFAILAPVPGGAGAALKAVRAAKEVKLLDRVIDTVKAFDTGYGLARSPVNPTAAAKISRLAQVVDQTVNMTQGSIMAAQEYQLGNNGWAAFNGGMAGLGAFGVWAKLSPCKLSCFAAGTLVLTEEGERPIEEIRVGDRVWAWNEETGENELAEVVRLFERETLEVFALDLEGDVIETTGEHPFWVVGRGWTEAENLRADDVLTSYDDRELRLVVVERYEKPLHVYNFEVNGLHSCYVSGSGVLVHNCSGIKMASGAMPKNTDDIVLYHGTSSSRALKIVGNENMKKKPIVGFRGDTFFAEDLAAAKHFARASLGNYEEGQQLPKGRGRK